MPKYYLTMRGAFLTQDGARKYVTADTYEEAQSKALACCCPCIDGSDSFNGSELDTETNWTGYAAGDAPVLGGGGISFLGTTVIGNRATKLPVSRIICDVQGGDDLGQIYKVQFGLHIKILFTKSDYYDWSIRIVMDHAVVVEAPNVEAGSGRDLRHFEVCFDRITGFLTAIRYGVDQFTGRRTLGLALEHDYEQGEGFPSNWRTTGGWSIGAEATPEDEPCVYLNCTWRVGHCPGCIPIGICGLCIDPYNVANFCQVDIESIDPPTPYGPGVADCCALQEGTYILNRFADWGYGLADAMMRCGWSTTATGEQFAELCQFQGEPLAGCCLFPQLGVALRANLTGDPENPYTYEVWFNMGRQYRRDPRYLFDVASSVSHITPPQSEKIDCEAGTYEFDIVTLNVLSVAPENACSFHITLTFFN